MTVAKPDSELDLQRRWADGDWPGPFLAANAGGEPLRVIAPGRWNRGPGPDFRGAQILDAEGRARRGDVEFHLKPRGWLDHGHHHDDAYHAVLLHLVAPADGGVDLTIHPDIPDSSPLPAAEGVPPDALCSSVRLPCEGLVTQAGAAAVEARLERIAQRRFWRKTEAILSLLDRFPAGAELSASERAAWTAVLSVAQALGQPHNAGRCLRGAAGALGQPHHAWSRFEARFDPSGWRHGRGALGSAAGCADVLTTLVHRWSEHERTPAAALRQLSALPGADAAGALQIPRKLGKARALQVLADAVYPFAAAWDPRGVGRAAFRHWCALPGARYLRTADLRERLSPPDRERPSRGVSWKHPQTQALLELEQTRCRQAACRICPLTALAR